MMLLLPTTRKIRHSMRRNAILLTKTLESDRKTYNDIKNKTRNEPTYKIQMVEAMFMRIIDTCDSIKIR